MEKGKGFLQEFQKFISRGNVMDMAVGVIIGGAFSSIINSLVTDIISPILGIFGGMNFDNYSLKLIGDATLNYGNLLHDESDQWTDFQASEEGRGRTGSADDQDLPVLQE